MNIKKIILSLLAGLCGLAFTAATDYNSSDWGMPVFEDNFGEAVVNRSHWSVISECWVNGEQQQYMDEEKGLGSTDWTIASGEYDPAAEDGKALILKARYMDGELQGTYKGSSENSKGKPLYIRSGRLESVFADETTFTYGKFEARLKMPPEIIGEFPAWWLLGSYSDVPWPPCNEIDIIEYTGANPGIAPQNIWFPPFAVNNDPHNTYADLGIDYNRLQEEYHTYGLIKTPYKVEFYVDGQKTGEFTRDLRDGQTMPWTHVAPMGLILNHAIGHEEWPDVGLMSEADMQNMVTRAGTDFVVDYVKVWDLPESDAEKKYADESKYGFTREPGKNTGGFYALTGWLAPVAASSDAHYENPEEDAANNEWTYGGDNAVDGYIGSYWATPADDNPHWVEVDYGSDKLIKYITVEWAHLVPSVYDIYGRSENGEYELITTYDVSRWDWQTHVFDINKSYRYLKLVTRGRYKKSDPVWLLELMAFEDVPNCYPKPVNEAGAVDPEVNVLSNGDFSKGMESWTLELHGGGATAGANGGEVFINITNPNGEDWNRQCIQLQDSNFSLDDGYQYFLEFDARATGVRGIDVQVSDPIINAPPERTSLFESPEITANWTGYSYTFTGSGGMPGQKSRLSFRVGGNPNSVYLKNIVLRRGAFVGDEKLVPALEPTKIESVSGPWETEWWGNYARSLDGDLASSAMALESAVNQEVSMIVDIGTDYEVSKVLLASDRDAGNGRQLEKFRIEYEQYGSWHELLGWQEANQHQTWASWDVDNLSGVQRFRLTLDPVDGQAVEFWDWQLMAIDHRPYKVDAYSFGGGTISPSGTRRCSISGQDDITFTLTPDPGYAIDYVLVDGVNQGWHSEYNLYNISENHHIAAVFKKSYQQELSSIILTPANSEIKTDEQLKLNATGYDQQGAVYEGSLDFTWSVSPSGAVIDQAGNFTSPVDDTFTVTASALGVSGNTQVIVSKTVLPASWAINCGGGVYTARDGTVYAADEGFDGGFTASTTDQISETADGQLYQSERWGDFGYSTELSNGTYEITFQFAETYWNAAGDRVFTVLAEGVPVISSLDIYARAGHDKAYDVVIPGVVVTDGKLDITVSITSDQAKISAIKVKKAEDPILDSVVISPKTASIQPSEGISFSAGAFDQNGAPINAEITFSSTGGTINSSTGLFSASQQGTYTVTATAVSGDITVTDSAVVTVEEPPVLTRIEISPDPVSLQVGENVQFTAAGYDQFDNPYQTTFDWTATGGTVTAGGLYTAGQTAGTFSVTASAGGINESVQVTITPAPPVLTRIVISPAGASLKPGENQQFTAAGYDQFDNPYETTFGWTATGGTVTTGGLYTAGQTAGTFSVTASAEGISKSAAVTIQNDQKVVWAVNCGGGAYTTQDGTVYAADEAFTGGYTASTTDLISGTTDAALYQSERWGNFGYQKNLPNGTYEITFQFAETYWNASGDRVFSVNAENVQVINNLDIYARAGHDKAIDIVVSNVTVTDGKLDISVNISSDQAKFSAIKVKGTEVQNPVLTAITVTPGSVSLKTGETGQFNAVGYDQFGAVYPATFSWSATGGPVTSSGLYTAGNTAGTFSVTASAEGVNASAQVTVIPESTGFTYTGIMPNGLVDGQQLSYTAKASFDGTNVTVTLETTASLTQVFLFTPGWNGMENINGVWTKVLSGYQTGDTLQWYYTAIGNGQADNSNQQHSWTIGQ